MDKRIVLVAVDVRSALNVGSLLRTADGMNAEKVYLVGYTPYPMTKKDKRLLHIQLRADRQITKTALGAEKNVSWEHKSSLVALVKKLRSDNFKIIALEQTASAKPLNTFRSKENIALIVGSEVAGLSVANLKLTDGQLEIPMRGDKESFNVAVAAAIALYHLRYMT